MKKTISESKNTNVSVPGKVSERSKNLGISTKFPFRQILSSYWRMLPIFLRTEFLFIIPMQRNVLNGSLHFLIVVKSFWSSASVDWLREIMILKQIIISNSWIYLIKCWQKYPQTVKNFHKYLQKTGGSSAASLIVYLIFSFCIQMLMHTPFHIF